MVWNWNGALKLSIVAGISLLSRNTASAQSVDFYDGSEDSVKFANNYGRGPAQSANLGASAGMVYFTRAFPSLRGTLLNMRIIGADPGAGASTTTIPTVILPIRVVFSDGTVLDGSNVVPAVLNSPIFQNADYTVGGTDLGNTQYLDAMQRGQFWNFPGFSQSGYHLLLGFPTILPAQTITVPASAGAASVNVRGTLVGRVDINFMSSAIDALATNGQFSSATLPMLITDNVVEYEGTVSNCCIVGYHNAESGPQATAHTWVFAAYARAGTFASGATDTFALSHEVTEWANDPFIGDFNGLNVIPPAKFRRAAASSTSKQATPSKRSRAESLPRRPGAKFTICRM